jgi:hypothetical protein
MIKNLHDLFPKEISDETAYHLVNFAMDLALALEAHYFGEISQDSEHTSFNPLYL